MKLSLHSLLISVALTVFVSLVGFGQEPKVSQGEVDAAKKVEAAKDVTAKLKAAEEFMKKNSKSSLRKNVASLISNQIYATTDPKARLSQIDAYSKIFTTDEEQNLLAPAKVDSLLLAGSTQEAFALAPKALAIQPDSAFLLQLLAISGRNALQAGKPDFIAASKEYGQKAIDLIEADKMPAGTNADNWKQLKEVQLPELYFSLGLFAFYEKDNATAKSKLDKAASLAPKNPNNYLMLAELANADYQLAAMEYNVASNKDKPAKLKIAEGFMDYMIDNYTHVLALIEGKAEMKATYDQVSEAAKDIYKIRNKGLDGFQKAIDKHKGK